MKRITLSAVFALLLSASLNAQQFFTKNGTISFFSKTPMENIDAKNSQVMSVLTLPSGDFKFSLMMKSFHFEKALMEEHFNENYVESEKYPKSTFNGKIADADKINLKKDGDYKVTVSGELTLHGVTQKITVPGVLTVKSGKLSATSTFSILLADYKVTVPKMVEANISKSIEISVNCAFEQK
jgi:polyisoprenoid-binding protein YceI